MLNISKKQLVLLLLSLFTLTLISYYHRYATGDDAWFAEQSYWLEKEGVIRSELFRGLLGWEKQLLVSHKLFLALGAMLIHFFGLHAAVVQCISIIFFIFFVAAVSYYIYKRENTLDSWYLLAILVLIFSNRILIKMSFENRPEIMLAAMGFASFLLIANTRTTVIKSIFAGLLAGLAVLAHLNATIYLFAGAGMLISRKEYKNSIAFILAGGITSLLYFVDIAQAENGFILWHYQFINDPATQNAMSLGAKLMVMLTYPKMFFHSPEQVTASLLLVFLLWERRKSLREFPQRLGIYSILLVFGFWLITKKNSGLYLTLFLPFMFVAIYELYKMKPFSNVLLKIVLATYLIIGLFGTGQIIYKNLEGDYLPVSYQKLRPEIPANKTGFVPLTFLFNEMSRHPRLLGHENFKIQLIMSKLEATPLRMAEWAFKNKADFILMDYHYRPEAFYPKAGTKLLPHYVLTFFNGRFAVYQTKKASVPK